MPLMPICATYFKLILFADSTGRVTTAIFRDPSMSVVSRIIITAWSLSFASFVCCHCGESKASIAAPVVRRRGHFRRKTGCKRSPSPPSRAVWLLLLCFQEIAISTEIASGLAIGTMDELESIAGRGKKQSTSRSLRAATVSRFRSCLFPFWSAYCLLSSVSFCFTSLPVHSTLSVSPVFGPLRQTLIQFYTIITVSPFTFFRSLANNDLSSFSDSDCCEKRNSAYPHIHERMIGNVLYIQNTKVFNRLNLVSVIQSFSSIL